jgi:hypothetical protein
LQVKLDEWNAVEPFGYVPRSQVIVGDKYRGIGIRSFWLPNPIDTASEKNLKEWIIQPISEP